MTKRELTDGVERLKSETHDALQTVVDELNKGHRQKIIKNAAVKTLLDRYGVFY